MSLEGGGGRRKWRHKGCTVNRTERQINEPHFTYRTSFCPKSISAPIIGLFKKKRERERKQNNGEKTANERGRRRAVCRRMWRWQRGGLACMTALPKYVFRLPHSSLRSLVRPLCLSVCLFHSVFVLRFLPLLDF